MLNVSPLKKEFKIYDCQSNENAWRNQVKWNKLIFLLLLFCVTEITKDKMKLLSWLRFMQYLQDAVNTSEIFTIMFSFCQTYSPGILRCVSLIPHVHLDAFAYQWL